MTKQHKAPERLTRHAARLFREEFSSLNWGKFWKELVAGSGLAVVGLAISIWYGLSISEDWDEHPVVVTLLAILPASILLADVCWRSAKALRRLYRERPHASFRDVVHATAALFCGWVLIIGVLGYMDYVTSPHLRAVAPKEWEIGSIPAFKGERGRPILSYVLFPDFSISNSGADSIVNGWIIHIRTIGGETVDGYPNLVDPHDEIGQNGFIFDKTNRSPVKRNTTVRGAASFVVVGVRPDMLSAPGTRFAIEFNDDRKRSYTLKFKTHSVL